MFRRAVTILLPLLILLCGCKALSRDREAVEYRPGPTLSTTVADCDAEYSLNAPEKHQTRFPVDVAKGERVGFQHDPDGSLVAVAGKVTMRIEPGEHYVWRCTPKPVTGLDRFAVKTRDKGENVAGGVALILLLPVFVLSGDWP
jgi:hypothetical protein